MASTLVYQDERDQFDSIFDQALRLDRSPATMARLEKNFKRNFMTKMRKYGAMAWAIETERTSAGISDAYCLMNGSAFWIEFKVSPHIIGSTSKPRYQPYQRRWMLDNMIHGGNSLVGIRYMNGYAFVRADAICMTTGGIPFDDERYSDYYIAMRTFDPDYLGNWVMRVFDRTKYPLLVNKVLEKKYNGKAGDGSDEYPDDRTVEPMDREAD